MREAVGAALKPEISYRVGADIGGTFTDVVLVGSDGSLATRKISSTPESYGRAIVDGIRELLAERSLPAGALFAIVHASTIATNAIIELKGAKTGLVTTKGFRDVLEMRRLRIPVLYDLQYCKPPPLVPRHLRVEVEERMGPRGAVWAELDEASVVAAAEALKRAGVASVAIALLNAYADPAHERRVEAIVRAHLPDAYITSSADILPEIREYERTSTAVVNAYIGPVVSRYLGALESDIRAIGVAAPIGIVQSNGGVMSLEAARRKPAYTVESGPAAGVIAGARLAKALGLAKAISFDMGGTTAKSAMIEDGEPAKTTEYEVGSGINLSSKLVKGGGYPIKLPFIDVSEIGAGGGSIVSLDRGGGLRVGPHSAGAIPGPVCYGLGGAEPTFTDAMVAAGYLNPHALAGGRVKLNVEPALALLRERIARPLGLSLEEAAYGIYTIAAATMTRAVKAVTTYRGRDPRDFTLIAFGGNGPVAAVAIARALSVATVMIPPAPGVFSALGLLMSDVEHVFGASLFARLGTLADAELETAFAALEDRARAELAAEGYGPERVRLSRFAELRYAGQAYELTIAADGPGGPAVLAARFHEEHRQTYGHASAADPVDLVSVRVAAQTISQNPFTFADIVNAGERERFAPAMASRAAYFGREAGLVDTPVLSRPRLARVWQEGPLIVEETDATCIVPPGARARLDDLGNIQIDVGTET